MYVCVSLCNTSKKNTVRNRKPRNFIHVQNYYNLLQYLHLVFDSLPYVAEYYQRPGNSELLIFLR